ncbi:hypothetical protein FKM95_000257 [Candidatus Tremblaya phenacola]|nr:hypothetical protein FKM95_000257 [Candidatus Tremblaya phenacola]
MNAPLHITQLPSTLNILFNNHNHTIKQTDIPTHTSTHPQNTTTNNRLPIAGGTDT